MAGPDFNRAIEERVGKMTVDLEAVVTALMRTDLPIRTATAGNIGMRV